MSTWYNKVTNNLAEIVPAIQFFEKELEESKFECAITGSLERASASLPGITEHRFNQLQEIEAILEFLNIELRKQRSQTFRKYLETYNRELSSRDATAFADGDDEVVTKTLIVNEFSMVRNKYLGIMKALEVKQWQIGHITRLRTAGMEDITL